MNSDHICRVPITKIIDKNTRKKVINYKSTSIKQQSQKYYLSNLKTSKNVNNKVIRKIFNVALNSKRKQYHKYKYKLKCTGDEMGSPHEFDFSKILDQTQYTYLSESLTNKDEFERPLGRSRGEKSPWAPPLKDSLVNRLRPMVVMVGALEVVIGLTLALAVILYEHDYNELYDTVDTGLVGLMSCGGLVVLTISGVMLLTSVFYDKKRLMRYHILLSTILCVYIFALSVVKIHFAIVVLERDIRKLILPESRHFLVSNACVIGISTMSGSVIHFIANVTVFTYYNLKYLRPILFNCGP